MNKQENENQVLIEDLNAENVEAIKGGDHKNWINVQSCNMGGHQAGGGGAR
jgi:hypothetical protein